MSGRSCILCVLLEHALLETKLLVAACVVGRYENGSDYDAVIDGRNPTVSIFKSTSDSCSTGSEAVLSDVGAVTICLWLCQIARRLRIHTGVDVS